MNDRGIQDRNLADTIFMTPHLVVDGNRLAFAGALVPGRETEAFATLLTFATFSVKTEEVVDEVYSNECARTGVASRLTEERWYQVAKEYFDEFFEKLCTATPEALLGHYRWLEKHFFEQHRGFEPLRDLIGRRLAPESHVLH